MSTYNYLPAHRPVGDIGDEFQAVTKWAVIGTTVWFLWTKTSLPRRWGLK
jgi:hypothetical protein